MALGIGIGIVCVFIGAFIVYGVFMVFLPEWVGITGKTALDYEKSHLEGSEIQAEQELIERIQRNPKS